MRKHLIINLVFILFFTIYCYPQNENIIPSSKAIANTSVAYREWSPFQNPSSLGHFKGMGVNLQCENKYIISELTRASINYALETKFLNIGVEFSYFGLAEYNEMIAGINFARKLGKKLSIGVELLYYTIYLSPSERYSGTLTTQIGVQGEPFNGFIIGFTAFNPVFSKIKYGENYIKELPILLSIGTSWQFDKKWLWLTQIDKEIKSPFRIATGVEFAPFENFKIKLGVYGNQTIVPTMGLGIKYGIIEFDLNTEFDSRLGFSLLGNVGFKFGLNSPYRK